jgi:hypothetical protein
MNLSFIVIIQWKICKFFNLYFNGKFIEFPQVIRGHLRGYQPAEPAKRKKNAKRSSNYQWWGVTYWSVRLVSHTISSINAVTH